MTMEPWRENSYLLRFEHLLEKTEDKIYSDAVTFNLRDVFGGFLDIKSVRETNLAGNQWLGDVKRFKFRAMGETERTGKEESTADSTIIAGADDSEKYSITLKAMEIRTFIIETRNHI